MARIFGGGFGDQERLSVLRVLKALPADWRVLTDHHWQGIDERGNPVARRVDFVVFAPGVGVVILDVEPAAHVRIGDDGRWTCRDVSTGAWIPREPHPIAEATNGAHGVAAQLGLAHIPCRFGWMLVFPSGDLVEGTAFRTFTPASFTFKFQLPDIGRRIGQLLDMHGLPSRSAGLTLDVVDRLIEERSVRSLSMPKAHDGADDLARINRLTQQQQAALHGIFQHRRVAVTGPAGSGKTVLAIWRLSAWIEEGRNAIYVCFTKKLAEYLRQRNPDYKERIFHVDSYFSKIAAQRRHGENADDARYFDQTLPGLVADKAIAWHDDRKFDGVVVDEGQDFGGNRLAALDCLLKTGGSYLYFADDRQDLFRGEGFAAVGAEVAFHLQHNCRNTTRINGFANAISKADVKSMPGLPDGVKPVVHLCPTPGDAATRAWQFARDFRKDYARVAILSPRSLHRSLVASVAASSKGMLVEDLSAWDQPGAILFSTIRSFKGLEADAVVMVDADDLVGDRTKPDERRVDAETYVAATRGRVRMTIIVASPAAREFFDKAN